MINIITNIDSFYPGHIGLKYSTDRNKWWLTPFIHLFPVLGPKGMMASVVTLGYNQDIMQIKAIFVDIGGVLVINDSDKIKEKYEVQYGLKRSTVSEIFQYLQITNRTKEEKERFLTEKNVSFALWNQYCSELFNSERRNEGLYEILQAAKKSGKLVVYTTNNSDALGSLMKKFNIDGLADLIINSTTFGVTKPDDKFWKLSLSESQKLRPGLIPSEVLVIDDSEINCSSAVKNGMKAIIYDFSVSDEKIAEVLEH